jgi:tRNA1Val (adenine37-N6)-methyltransferase
MANSYFQFKKFIIHQDRSAMKVTTDGCLFGAWVAKKLSEDQRDQNNILDIGTGTGLLSLMLAQKTTGTIDALEIEQDACEQAILNVSSSPWKDRIRIINQDASSFVNASKYDTIISNPPFYENELKSPDLKRNIAHHSGLSLANLLEVIKENLSEKGTFYLLLPYKRIVELESKISTHGLSLTQKMLLRQSGQHDYFRVMVAGGHDTNDVVRAIEEISIKNNDQQYTVEFISLLQDYYLHL